MGTGKPENTQPLFEKQQIVSFSGGKDSTAMLHMMLDRGEDIAAVVFFDTGWEFPAMHDHIDLVEQKTGIEIVRLKPDKSLDYEFTAVPVKSSEDRPEEGVKKGEIRYYGRGWASKKRRWCTRIKNTVVDRYILSNFQNPISCIGFANDEKHRTKDNNKLKIPQRYPLIDWKIFESDALKYCFNLGYRWDGLYNHFDRVSCFCCPLQGLEELRKLRTHFPELWRQMLAMDLNRPTHNKGFKGEQSVHDLDHRFAFEDSLAALGVPDKLHKRWGAKYREVDVK